MRRKVIIDTDCSSDTGDFGALAVALLAHKAGVIEILAICVQVSNVYSPGIVTALCNAMGVPGIQIGTWKGAAFDPNAGSATAWTGYVYAAYGSAGVAGTPALASSYPDARSVFASVVAGVGAEKVDVLSLGFLNNLRTYLEDGAAAITAKVRCLWGMGGEYPSGSEFNFGSDKASANYVLANWPTTTIWLGYTAGLTPAVGASLHTLMPADDIVRVAFFQYIGTSGNSGWDEMATYAYVFGLPGMRLVRGNNSVNAGNGVNTFTASQTGRDYYIAKNDGDIVIGRRLDDLLTTPRNTSTISFRDHLAALR